MPSDKCLVQIYLDLHEAVSHPGDFKKPLMDCGQIKVALALTNIAQHSAKSPLPTFPPAFRFLPISAPKADKFDTDFAKTLSERNTNRVSRPKAQLGFWPIMSRLHFKVKPCCRHYRRCFSCRPYCCRQLSWKTISRPTYSNLSRFFWRLKWKGEFSKFTGTQ